MKWKTKKTTWVFVFQKCGKFWSVFAGTFHNPLISEEWFIEILFWMKKKKGFKSELDWSLPNSISMFPTFILFSFFGQGEAVLFYTKIPYLHLLFTLTLSHDEGVCSVTGICLTVPRPRASLFRWAANNRSSFFSSSFKLLQYLQKKVNLCKKHSSFFLYFLK